MNILVDITHPAHAHFFKNAIRLWIEHGHEVIITARDKEMNLRLLDAFNFKYTVLSRVKKGMFGLFGEMIQHESRLYRIARTRKAQILLQISGAFIVHAGKLLGTPSLVFYDTDNATLSNAITYPFATRICTPDCYPVSLGVRHVPYPGYHELAYLHPNRFTPDPSVLRDVGLKAGDPFYLLRFVSWGATHDVGESGLSPENKLRFARELEKTGRVFITSESALPPDFDKYRISVGVERVHDLMAFARMYVGESATMASECAVLGIPAIYISKTGRCYTTEQESRYGLVFNYSNDRQEEAFARMKTLVATPDLAVAWQEKRRRMLADKIDVTGWMVDFVERFPVRTIAK